ncbi:MAG: hypothetical protein H7Y09_01440 [Chitinophagaceae bacterium]|nr:hypothetical protein [Anaerolineae bacterium]
MNTEITLSIPEHIFQRAQRLADLTGREVLDVLSGAIDRSLPPLVSELDSSPLESLSDEAIIALADSRMDDAQNTRMSLLQYRQQARSITEEEIAELHMLMDIYNAGQLRKTHALVEAVKRGLRSSGNA